MTKTKEFGNGMFEVAGGGVELRFILSGEEQSRCFLFEHGVEIDIGFVRFPS
jgi:hypothetical protein